MVVYRDILHPVFYFIKKHKQHSRQIIRQIKPHEEKYNHIYRARAGDNAQPKYQRVHQNDRRAVYQQRLPCRKRFPAKTHGHRRPLEDFQVYAALSGGVAEQQRDEKLQKHI